MGTASRWRDVAPASFEPVREGIYTAAYNKFSVFVEHIFTVIHFLFGTAGAGGVHVCKVYLTNATPAATNTVKANVAEISAGNGYTAGGVSVANVGSRTGGTFTLVGTSFTVTAAGGTIGPFQHAVLYNDTPTSPADPLIAWWDRGAALTLQNGESFSVKFDDVAVGSPGTIFTTT